MTRFKELTPNEIAALVSAIDNNILHMPPKMIGTDGQECTREILVELTRLSDELHSERFHRNQSKVKE